MKDNEKINMTPDEYEHNIKVLTALARVETLQQVSNSEFMEHKAEDRIHFDRIYDSLENLERGISANTSDFKVFQTKVIYTVMGAITLSTALGTILNIFLTGSKLIN